MFTHSEIEAIKAALEKLNRNAKQAVIVVEGKKDAAALKHLVNPGRFFLVNNGKKRSLYESAEKLAEKYRKAVLLLDADAKGKRLSKMLTSYLQQNGVSVTSGTQILNLTRRQNVEALASLQLE